MASGVSPSIVRRVNGERLTVLGWGRAILMQLAHPLIAAGVAEHSHFRSTPLGAVTRLRRTVVAMLALTFGDDAEADRAVRGILAIHDRVHGRLPAAVGGFPAGTPYSAHDPNLLLWVHATLLDSSLHTYKTLVAPLRPEDGDAYVREAADAVGRLGLDPERAPRTVAEVQAYLAAMLASDRIAVSPLARQVADAVLSPWLLFPANRIQRLLTIGALPPVIRGMYGYPWSSTRQRRLERVQRAIRLARATAPGFIARFAAARRRGSC
jgi:uncharacterized protein (DUF2236 family)